MYVFFFFFSSRRRHTRFKCDWSSDVCSSDLHAVQAGTLHGVIGLGGLQGTAVCTEVMRALPYGLPKVMVSTVASGNTAAYVDVMDITMMFSVADIIGLNAFLRKVLANAAGAAHGMAQVEVSLPTERRGQTLIRVSNLGVLTSAALLPLHQFAALG